VTAPGEPAELLATITGPKDLRALHPEQLPRLAQEVRELLVTQVCRTGGHLGPNLGVVELTIALHRVFESPRDAIIWDVGHQAYVHKALTGRADAFATLRQAGGLSGYPSRAESEHDWVEDSHASTALSWADGLARATAAGARPPGHVVAVVGDGGLTGGMAWEALNSIGAAPERPVVVVLNDNGRSYSPTVGAVAQHLADLRGGSGAPGAPDRELFAALGLAHLGPVDGHDIPAVEDALARARDLGRPVLVHCVTRKGAGFPAAEADEADRQHAVPPRPARAAPAARPAWTDVLAEELAALADERPDLVAVTAAMLHPTGLGPLAEARAERVHDVGIAEQHALTTAAGMALGGLHPVVCLYATFLNRAFDQLVMDVALHRLPVTLVLDRAGVTGPDGPSHHGMWDLGLLAAVPGMRVAAPRDADALRSLLREAVAEDGGPTALRFPKGSSPRPLPAMGRVGRGEVLAGGDGGEVLLLPVGPLATAAVEAAGDLDRTGTAATVVDPRWVLPVDPALLERAVRHRLVVTVEDGAVSGGFGDAVGRALRDAGARTPLRTLGLPQAFLPHGEREAILAEHGLDAVGIARAVREALGRRTGRALERVPGRGASATSA
jgi:1-deoxy-D-xylulose-5-phosphate synthase